MTPSLRVGLIVALLLAAPLHLVSQRTHEDVMNEIKNSKPEVSVAPSSNQFPDRWYTEHALPMVPVFFTGLPYIATEEKRVNFKLEDGKTFTRVERFLKMRDSAGRERSEANTGTEGDFQIVSVQVIDPVSHCHFGWRTASDGRSLPTEEQVAIVRCAPRSAVHITVDIQQLIMEVTPSPTENVISERFAGVRDGVSYVGVRNINHGMPADSDSIGVEIWYSKEMHLELRHASILRNGSYGDSVELLDIRRTEPDIQLFYPPGNYTIYTESEFKALEEQRIKERDQSTRSPQINSVDSVH